MTAPGAEPNTPMEQQDNRLTPARRPRHRVIRPARWASMVGALLVAAIAPAGEQPPTNDQAPPSPVPVQREPSARKARTPAPLLPEAKKPAAAKVRRPVGETRELAAKVRVDNPDLT